MNRNSLDALVLSPEPHLQLARFVVIGAANTLFSYGLYALGLLIGLPYYLASLSALCVGILISFATQGRIVFRSRLVGRFGRFAAIWFLLYLFNIACIAALAGFGLDHYSAGLIAIVPVTAISFLLQRQFVFDSQESPLLAAVRRRPLAAFLCLALGTCALLRVHMLFGFEINWDEFLNLSMVHDWRRGELHGIFQTAFVHLFGWLPAISINEVDQVVAGRVLIAVFGIVTSLALYRIGRLYVSAEAALFAVLAYNAFTFVFRHGISLRTDPIATACMMVAVWLSVEKHVDRGRAVALGALVGLAGTMTIKAIFYLPVLGTIFLVRLRYERARPPLVHAALVAAGTALATFSAVLWAHAASLVRPDAPFDFLARTSGATLVRSDHSVFLEFAGRALVENWWFWLLLTLGLAAAVGRLRDCATRRDGLILLSFALPLLTPIAYSETYPYFYAFVLAPTAVLAGLGLQQLMPLSRGFYAGAAVAVVAVTLAVGYADSIRYSPSAQRRTLALVHHLFPQPVPYIDANSMVSSFPKRGLFMSRWGMRDYRAASRPVMADLLHESQPRFLLDSRGSLDLERLDADASQRHRLGLLAEDVAVLQASFVDYWGPIHVPGISIATGRSVAMVRLAGDYKLHSDEPVVIDGRLVRPGQTLNLPVGMHAFAAAAPFQLRLDLPPPPRHEAAERLFHGF